MKNWVKGGLIGGGIGLIFIIIFIINAFVLNDPHYPSDSTTKGVISILNFPFAITTIFMAIAFCGFERADGLLGGCTGNNELISQIIIIFISTIVQLIIFFIIGAVIGLLIKPKNNKNVKTK